MTLLVVNYHYVADERVPAPRGIFPVSIEGLRSQLELLGRACELVSRDELIAAVRAERALPAQGCLVTFDDGLRSQFELAVPVLEALGMPALFLVPGQPLAEGRALHVHRVHAARARFPDDELERRLQAAGADPGGIDPEEARAHYPYDESQAARIKFLLNVVLPLDRREALLAQAVGIDDAELFRDLYMSPAQVVELGRRGWLGAHGYAHQPLAVLDPQRMRRDLELSSAALERITGSRPKAISYPHGSPEAVTPAVASAAREAGFGVGFTMERALNHSLEEPLLLARVDANDAPGGARPLSELGPRRLYLDEAVAGA